MSGWKLTDAYEMGYEYECPHCHRHIDTKYKGIGLPDECPYCNQKVETEEKRRNVMQITIEIDETKVQDAIISECVRYVREKQMPQMLGIISKQVAQEIKGEVVDSGMIEKRVDETVKRVENTLMTRANKQITETMDKAVAMSACAVERSASLSMDSKSIRDHIIAAVIGFQNGMGNDTESEEYKAYQKVLVWIEDTYGPMMS